MAEEAVAEPVAETPTTETPAVETPKAFDPSTISPEVKSYYEKQYDGHTKYKEMATEYEQMLRTKEFQEWYQGLRNPKPAPEKKQELSDEDFVAALSDKNKFAQLIREEAKRLLNEEYGPKLQETQTQIALSQKTNELQAVIKDHPDFMELDKKGLIEPYLRKYPNMSYEDCYKLAKSENFSEEVDKKARGLVESKKNAIVEKPGTSSGGRSHKVKAKSRLEAMEIAAEAYRAGREVPEIDYD